MIYPVGKKLPPACLCSYHFVKYHFINVVGLVVSYHFVKWKFTFNKYFILLAKVCLQLVYRATIFSNTISSTTNFVKMINSVGKSLSIACLLSYHFVKCHFINVIKFQFISKNLSTAWQSATILSNAISSTTNFVKNFHPVGKSLPTA
jgi:hypothetical protein